MASLTDVEILVFGTINMDQFTYVKRLPELGETLSSERFSQLPGGKAANQSVAVSRMGKKVGLVGKVGNDSFGKDLIETFSTEDVNIDHVFFDNEKITGNSFVMIDEQGNNAIITNLGSNENLNLAEVQQSLMDPNNIKIASVQMEMASEVREFIIERLHDLGIKIILNLAPVVSLSESALIKVDVLVVNEVEAFQMIGEKVRNICDAMEASKKLKKRSDQKIVITLGEQGCVVNDLENIYHIKAPKVEVINTTSAGDCFCGCLAAFWLEDDFESAVKKAVYASALSVTREGAINSLPYKTEVNQFYYERTNEKNKEEL